MPWELEFYRDDKGVEPAKVWLDRLDEVKQAAALRALSKVLAEQGPSVCEGEYGKPLGDGLYEFRLRHHADEVLKAHAPHLLGKVPLPEPQGKVLLRIFFCAHGDRLILLLGGYDKGEDPSERRQQREIKRARKRMRAWKQRQERSGGSPFRVWWIHKVRGRTSRRE